MPSTIERARAIEMANNQGQSYISHELGRCLISSISAEGVGSAIVAVQSNAISRTMDRKTCTINVSDRVDRQRMVS